MVHSFRDRRRNILIADASQRGGPAWFLVAIASLLLAISTPAGAQVLTWDPNGASAGTGGSGAWNTTSPYWTGTSGTVAWPVGTATTGTNNDAVFAGTSGTVTVQAAGVFASDLTFSTTGYLLTGGTITMTSSGTGPTYPNANTITVDPGVTVEISNDMLLNGGFTKAGCGTLIFSGSGNRNISWNSLPPFFNQGTGFDRFDGVTILKSGTLGRSNGNRQSVSIGSALGAAFIQTGGVSVWAGTNFTLGWSGAANVYGFYGISSGTFALPQVTSALSRLEFGI